MRTRADGAVAPISHEGLNAQQHREVRNLGLLAIPAACDADVAHEMENRLEYALAARTEHRPDGAQEHTMEILLEYALATSNPLSEHSSDGEVIAIPNTFKEAMESPQAAKRKEASDKEMASLENHEVIDLSVFGFNSLGEEGHRDEMGVQGQSRPQTERTSRGSAPGTSAGNRQRLHLRSSVPYPEYPDGPRQCLSLIHI